jgi:sugar (pentulose or hexulose) kinase
LKAQLLLGIDAGLSATKAALFDRHGREVSAVSVSNAVLRPRPGSAERAMDEAWASAALVVRKALNAAGVDGGAVAGIGVTGAMVGVWPIDADGRPVRPAVLVADVRGQEVIDRIAARGPDVLSRIFAVDGCVVEPGCTLPVLRWLLDEEPETMAAARHVLTCKDWLRYRLTGAVAADVTEAAVAPGDARARPIGRDAAPFRTRSRGQPAAPCSTLGVARRGGDARRGGRDRAARGNAGRDRRGRRAVLGHRRRRV